MTPAQLKSWQDAAASYRELALGRIDAAAVDTSAAPTSSVGGAAWAASLSPALRLPAPNDFIATDFELRHEGLRAKAAAALLPPGEGAEKDTGAAAAPPSFAGLREPVPALLRDDDRATVWRE